MDNKREKFGLISEGRPFTESLWLFGKVIGDIKGKFIFRGIPAL